MNIVNIEDFFHPDAGYQINILSKYLIKLGHEVTIVTSEMENIPESLTAFFGDENIEEKDALYTKQTGVKIIRVHIKNFISGRAFFDRNLSKIVDRLNPDILYVHGNDTVTGMKYINKTNKLSYPLILDSHMLEMASANKFNKLFRLFYKLFLTPKIIKNKIPIIRTQDDDYVEKHLGIPLSQAPWISYGSDTLLFHPDNKVRDDFRAENDINLDDFVVVYTGKLDEAKGGNLLAEAFMKKFNTDKNVVLIVVGNISGEYGKKVAEVLNKSENRIIRFETQKYTDLPKFYQIADLSVFAKQCSLSFYDAQACGLPVLSEDNNINVDRCSHNNGWNFKSGDIDDFSKKIEFIVNMPHKEFADISVNAYNFIKQNYNYEDKAKEYEKILLAEYNKFNKKRDDMRVSSPIRVLQITTALRHGGVQTFLMNYARNIDKSKVIFDYVIQTDTVETYDDEVIKNGSRIFHITPLTQSKIKFMIDLFKLLKNHPEYKIIHSHLNFSNIFSLFVAKLAKVTIRISHSHSNYNATSITTKAARYIFRLFLSSFATEYWACSTVASKWLYGEKRINSCIVIHNAIDPNMYKFNISTRKTIRSQLSLTDNTVWIHTGSFSDAKNHSFLLDLFARQYKENPKSKLILCGEGPNRNEIIRQIKSLKLENEVLLLGNVNNCYEYLMASDIFVFPSLYEGLPLSVVEAQATGISCIVSSAVPDGAIFSKECFVCNNYNIDNWLEEVNKLLSYENTNRDKSYNYLLINGYDIQNESKILETRYSNLYNKRIDEN